VVPAVVDVDPVEVEARRPRGVGDIGVDVTQVFRRVVHAPHFSTGPSRHIEKASKFDFGESFEPFGDVIHHGNPRSLNLVAKAEIF